MEELDRATRGQDGVGAIYQPLSQLVPWLLGSRSCSKYVSGCNGNVTSRTRLIGSSLILSKRRLGAGMALVWMNRGSF
jgi:hypothetical protein